MRSNQSSKAIQQAAKALLRRGFLGLVSVLVASYPSIAANTGIGFSGHVSRDSGGLALPGSSTVSFTDVAGLRMTVSNRERTQSTMRLTVYDDRLRRIDAEVIPQRARLAAGESLEFTVFVPFEGLPARRLVICAETVSSNRPVNLVCGNHSIRHLSLNE